VGIVAGVAGVLLEGDGVGHLLRHSVDLDLDPERIQARHQLIVEVRDAARIEGDELARSFTGDDGEIVVDEVEIDLEDAASVGERPSGETAGGEVEGGVPELILERGELDIELADDLGPHVQGFPRVGPGIEGQRRPALVTRERGWGGTVGDGHRSPRDSRAFASTASSRSKGTKMPPASWHTSNTCKRWHERPGTPPAADRPPAQTPT
jgi:hypothetical protein